MMAECGKFHTNVSEDRAASHGELGLEVALDFAHVLGSAGLPSNCDMALAKVSRDREVVLSASSTTNGVPDAPEVQAWQIDIEARKRKRPEIVYANLGD